MGNKQIVKRMIDLQKKSFYNCFSTMVMLQDLAENLLKNFLENIPISDEGKKVMDQWNSTYKKSRDNYMKAVDDEYAKVEAFFGYNNAMVDLQEHAERLLRNFIDNIPAGMSDEGKKVMDQWSGAYKKNRDDFMKAVDDGYAKGESFLDYNTKDIFKNWIPLDFKKSLEEMTAMHKKNREEFKKFIDENFRDSKVSKIIEKKE